MATGAILQAASYNLPTMFCGRIIAGLGNGINTATAPVWQTETSQARWRGKLVLLEMWMNILGFSICNWLNYGMVRFCSICGNLEDELLIYPLTAEPHWRIRCLAIPPGLPIHLHLHPLGHRPMASRVSSLAHHARPKGRGCCHLGRSRVEGDR